MRFLLRPSKIFAFDMLERELKCLTGKIGLDACCENLKNRNMFRTEKYYGLDRDLKMMKSGVDKHTKNVWGIYADLRHIEALPSNSVDVLVSTNTLYHLPKENTCGVIAELSRLVCSDGTFLLELPLDGEYDKRISELSRHFGEMRVIYFRNPANSAYEQIFEREGDGFLGAHSVAGRKPLLALSWLLSRLEYITCYFRSLNKHAFIIATQKRKNEATQLFDLTRFPMIEDRIYDLSSKVEN